MRRLYLSLGLLAVLFSAGCDRMDTDPIFAYGSAWNRDGTPLAGATLAYERTLQTDPPNGGGPPAPFRMPDFKPYGTAATEASGDFFLEMRFGDVQAPDPTQPEWARQPYRFRVSRLEEDGTGTFVSFLFWDDVELPALKPWDARLTVEQGPGGQVVSFQPAPPVPELPPTGELANTSTLEQEIVPAPPTTPEAVLLVTSEGKTVYRWWGATSPWTASPYILEDFASPALQLRALSLGEWLFRPLGAVSSFLTFRMEWRTAVEPLPVGGLVPVSRGASCEPSPGEGACPWTDGRLEQVGLRDGPIGPSSLIVTLAEPRRLRHAVVRGMSGHGGIHFKLEGSLDGEQWSLLALSPLLLPERDRSFLYFPEPRFGERTQWDSPFDGPLRPEDGVAFGEAPLADVGPVRLVRFTAANFSAGNPGQPFGLSSLAELSLFE
ncbi:hypothetical protein [Pyxidicoccus xibeiensis]|uniref:hypothetical protein n=1 Tax=Pyxidicoccus xibeiensis TaxID=2906759 RepID=UPI0020A7FCDC|nr:hypothetical protein [Pyxidicoccus xibeiensis]MCP3143508.1 hypothetical protein [Pyxidicoccus xibeiensis]